MDTATLDYLKDVSNRLKTAVHGQKSVIVEQSAKFLNCSGKQVYAMLKQAGLTPQTKKGDRKVRTDKGKTVITEEQAKLIGGMILVATRNNGKRILSVKDATEILKAQGKLPDVDVSTILRALKCTIATPTSLPCRPPTPAKEVCTQTIFGKLMRLFVCCSTYQRAEQR